MSLIAWYPLNGDAKDYSGNNFHLTNNGATVDASGKIGSCYRFDRDQNNCMGYDNLNCSNMTQAFTVSAWYKDSSTDNSYSTIVTLGMSAITIDCEAASSNIRAFIYIGDNPIVLSAKYVKNKWTHVTFKLENKNLYLYLNGELKSKTSVTGISRIKNIDSIILGKRKELSPPRYLQGYLNDVRIYNEALSTKQIKEITQAKICHYTFNDNIQPTNNLCKQYPIKKNITNNATYKGTIFGQDEIGEYFIKQSTSYTWDGVGIRNIPMKTGVYYTVSFEIWCEKSFELIYDYNISCNNIAGNDAPRAEHFSNYGTSYNTPKRWKKFSMRSKAKDDAVNPWLHDCIAGYQSTNTSMVGTKIYYRNVMVEEKDRETNYIEGKRSIMLKDVSGFNDLNITETQTYSFPAYTEDSLKFSSYSEINSNIELSTNNIGSDSQLTTVSWIKPTAIPTVGGIGLIYGRANFQGFGLGFGYKDENNIAIYAYHRLSGGAKNTPFKWIKINEWVQVACVLDNVSSKLKLFINGQKACEVESSTGEFTNSKKTLMFGGLHYPWGNGPWVNFEGHIKDFRMYATALSDEDIRLLYSPEINIDKSNVIRCSNLNEQKEKVVSESVTIVSAGYGSNQGKYKIAIGNKYSTTEKAVGWCVTAISIDNTITHKTFRTHGVSNEFIALKKYVESLPSTSTILLSTYDQPSAGNSGTANNDTNCKNWIDYLKNKGATQIDGSFVYRAAYAAIIQEGRVIAEGIHNSDTNSIVTLNKMINLKFGHQGFNKDASIAYNEFNEIPNLESGVHNLRLGNEILPVLIDMDKDGGRWARVFYHNCKRGTVLFSNSNAYAEAKETNKNAPTTSDKYSILSKLEHFRPNTKSAFEFKLTYPIDTNSGLNKWTMKQYSKQLSSANAYPLLSDIQGLNPTLSMVIDDTQNFISNDIGDYYIRHYKTKVYCNMAKTISFQMKNDDSVTIYVNSNIAVQRVTTSAFSDVKLSFNKGWNTLEILYYEHTFNDYFLFNKKISDLVDILDYNGSYNDCNIWKQTSNPTHQKVIGYKPIKITWTSDFWGGLEYSGDSTFIDGSVNHGNWYYAIGSSTQHLDGIPSARQNANGSTANDVELWVRINNYDLFADNFINNVSISRNGILTAKEFREI